MRRLKIFQILNAKIVHLNTEAATIIHTVNLILTNLFLIREELLEKLRHFPVDYFLRSIGIRNKRRETEKRLDEIDYAIRIFQLTDVFLKM